MAGYRCVNFNDLCRLCSNETSSASQIYSNEILMGKINECLSITLNEKDKLPKVICSSCKDYVETFSDFRKSCSNAQKMLISCLNSTKLRNGGQVYIKDEAPIKKVLKPIQNPSPTKIIPNFNLIATSPVKQIKKSVVTNQSQSDFLSNIIKAVGIQSAEDASDNNLSLSQPSAPQHQQPSLPQYTFTLDGNTLKSGQIQYKIENAGSILKQTPIITAKNLQDLQNQQITLNQVDEFLKLKQKPSLIVKKDTINASPSLKLQQIEEPKDKKPKFNLILQTSSQKQPVKNQQPQILSPVSKGFTSPNKPQILNIEKILPVSNQTSPKQVVVPIMVRNDGNRNTLSRAAGDAAQLITQALAMSANQTENKPSSGNQQHVAYVQVKLQPNASQQLQLSLSPQQLQQLSFQATNSHQLQQPSITAHQSSQISVPVAQQDIQTQTPSNVQASEKMHESNQDDDDDDVFNDSFDNDFYTADDSESLLNESQEKSTVANTKKQINPTKKITKSFKTTKTKVKNESLLTDIQAVNEEHSDMAKKQLTQLTNFNNKKSESENVEKANGINLTICEVCKKVFKRKEFLMQHLKSHIGLRPFKCDEAECNKSFSRKEHLLRHVSSHTGKKEFICNVCNKLFSRKDNLNKHKRIHPEIGQQNVRHNCQNCDKGFSHKSQLLKHQLICDGKGDSGDEVDVKEFKIKSPTAVVAKKVKIKHEKITSKEASQVQNQIHSSQQQPKLVQVLQTQQPPQMTIKNENQPQIILSMSPQSMLSTQQSKAVYTFPTNFILNPNGTFMAATNEVLGNLKFETQ